MNRNAHFTLAGIVLAAVTGTLGAQTNKGTSSPPPAAAPPAPPPRPVQQPAVQQSTQRSSQGQNAVQRPAQPVHPNGPLSPNPNDSGTSRTTNHTVATSPHVLSSAEATAVLQQLKQQRSGMQGINRASLPRGTVSVRENNMREITVTDGRKYQLRANGSLVSYTRGETVATFRPDGTPRIIHTSDITVVHGVHGDEHFEAVRPGGGRVVGWGPNEGFVERPLVRDGVKYVQRTYLTGGATYTRVYRSFDYHGIVLARYVPPIQYSTEFYRWMHQAWEGGVRYEWGGQGSPLAAAYGRYFAPAQVYTSASLWLTDYVLANYSRQAYDPQTSESRVVASGDTLTETPITPEVKTTLETQVQTTLNEAESSLRSQSGPAQETLKPVALDPTIRNYLVASNLSVTDENMKVDCNLTRGDSLILPQPVKYGATSAHITVTWSHPGDCAANSSIQLGIAVLEEMNNQYIGVVFDGSATLSATQGRDRIPAGPPSGAQSTAGQPDPSLAVDVARELSQQEQNAALTEKKVEMEVGATSINPH